MNIFSCQPKDYHSQFTCNRANIFAEDSYLSKSVLWELNSSSLYKWRYHQEEKKITDAMRWGTLIDCFTTTPDLIGSEVMVSPYDSYRTKEAKEWKEEQDKAKKIIATKDDMEQAKLAAKMLTETCKASADIFAKSKSQVVIAGQVLGVKLKGLCDLAPEGEDFLADLKTTGVFSMDGFSRQTASLGYHVQSALYLRLWNAMNPDNKRNSFKLIWQDNSPPYECCVKEVDPVDIDLGWAFVTKAIDMLIEATENNKWPLPFQQEGVVSMPTWATMQMEEKIQRML